MRKYLQADSQASEFSNKYDKKQPRANRVRRTPIKRQLEDDYSDGYDAYGVNPADFC